MAAHTLIPHTQEVEIGGSEFQDKQDDTVRPYLRKTTSIEPSLGNLVTATQNGLRFSGFHFTQTHFLSLLGASRHTSQVFYL